MALPMYRYGRDSSNVGDFVRSVVKDKNYSAKFQWPSSVVEQLRCHKVIEDAIEELGGFYTDESRCTDLAASNTLKAADKLMTNKDIKFEALYSIYYYWDNIERFYANFGWAPRDVNLICNELYAKMAEIENTPVDFITGDKNGVSKLTCVHSHFYIETVNYEDTGLEFTIYFSPWYGDSTSYDWTEEERKKFKKPVIASWLPKYSKTEERTWPVFGTLDSISILTKEIISLRHAWKSNDDSAIDSSISERPYFAELEQHWPTEFMVASFIADFFTVNDTEVPCGFETVKYLIDAVFKSGFDVNNYSLGDNWYFSIPGDPSYSQYFVSVLKDDGGDGKLITVLNLDQPWRAYYSENNFESF